MVLPLLIPIIGAAIGGAAAYAAGGAVLTGMAVGWMVGSWLFPMGNQQGLDPEAAQLQDVNQALRGIDIPVLFGTNRVVANVIIRDNFFSDKQTEKKGGFLGFGGSKVTTGYKYGIDLILHFGIPYDNTREFRTYAGWWDGQIFTDGSMHRFTLNESGDHPLMSEDEALGHIQKFLNQSGGDGEKGLKFRSAHWSSGALDCPLWDEAQSLNDGQPVRWPGTVWVGFEALDLGDQARIPAMSFEIGPAADQGAVVGDGDGVLYGPFSGNTNPTDCSRILDNQGNYYEWAGNVLRIMSASGTYIHSMNDTNMIDWFNAYVGSTQFLDTLDSSIGFCQPVMNGQYVVFGGRGRDGGGTDDYQIFCAVLEPPTAAGSPNILGMVWARSTLQWFRGAMIGAEVAHLQRDTDPIIFKGAGNATLNDHQMQVFPPISEIIAGDYDGGFGSSPRGLGWTATFAPREVPRITYLLPTTDDRDGFDGGGVGQSTGKSRNYAFALPIDLESGTHTALWVLATKGWHLDNAPGDSDDHDAYANSISTITSAQLGGAFYYLFNGHGASELSYDNLLTAVPSTNLKLWGFFTSGPTVVSSRFLDTDGSVAVPFDDDWELLTSAGSAQNNSYGCMPFIRKDNDTRWCLGWAKPFSANTADTASRTRLPIKVRGFTYNRDTFISIGAGVNTEAATGDWQGVVINFASWNVDGSGNLKMTMNPQLAGDYVNDMTLIDWGTFECTGVGSAVDLTPPEIIRHILVNTVYGMGFDISRIDIPSWSSAVGYCTSEDFYVSGIYKTSQDRSQYVEHLLATYGGFLVWNRGQIKFGFVTGSDTVVRTLTNEHHAVNKTGDPPLRVAKGSRQDTFNQVSVNFLDRRLAYRKNTVQIGDDADQDQYGVRAREFPGIFVMTEGMASKIAHRTLWAGLFARDIISGAFGWRDADLEPGDVVWLVDTGHPELQNGVRARIGAIAETAPGFFSYDAIQEDPNFLNDPGFVSSETIGSPGNLAGDLKPPRAQASFEFPKEFVDANQIVVAWAPNGSHAGAKLYISASSNGTFTEILEQPEQAISVEIQENWGGHDCDDFLTARPLTFNAASGHALPSSSNYAYTLTFSGGIVPEDRHDGNGIFLIGSEVVAVESLTVVGSNQYRAGRIYRGWGGTNIQVHTAGDIGFWLNQAVLFRNFLDAEIGKTFFFKVVPFNIFGDEVDINSCVAIEHTVVGGRYLPQIPAPIHTWVVASETDVISKDLLQLRTFTVNSGDDITFTWKDSARCMGFGFGLFGAAGYGDFTTDTTSHNWTVVIVGSGGNDVRSTVVDTGWFVYTHSANVADNGAFGPFAIRVTPVNSFGNARRTQVRTCDVYERA